MGSYGRITVVLACLGLFMSFAMPGRVIAQTVYSNVEEVQILAQPFNESLSILVSPSVMNFVLVPNYDSNLGDVSLGVSLDYVLSPDSGTQNAKLSYYFVGPNGLTNGADAIPSNKFAGQTLTGGSPYYTFGTATFPAGRYGVFELIPISGSGSTSGGLTSLKVSTVGVTLAPGNYTGTLFVEAQVH